MSGRGPTVNGDRREDVRVAAEQHHLLTGRALEEIQGHLQQLHRHIVDAGQCHGRSEGLRAEADHRIATTAGLQQQLDRWASALAAGSIGPDSLSGPVHPSGGDWNPFPVELDGRVRFDVVVDARLGDPVTEELALGDSTNRALVGLMLQLIRPGDRILDLGAHVGIFSLAAAAVGAQALAVEASPENVALLRASACRNLFDNLVVAHAVVSDTPGTAAFLSRGPWGQVVGAGYPDSVPVPAVTVSDLVTELAWRPVSFIKMDVEGSELRALRGMHDILVAPDAPPLLFESNGFTLVPQGARPEQLIAHLEDLGYASFLVDPPRLVHARSTDLQPHTVVDYLAVKQVPEALVTRGWKVEPPMEPEERAARIIAECREADPFHRAYIADALRSADEGVLADPGVRAAILALRDDPDDQVRSVAASWSPQPGENVEAELR